MSHVLIYLGATVVFLWGIGYLIPTRSIVAGFAEVSTDNRRIITMEWIAEGLALCFRGALPAITASTVGAATTEATVPACAATLVVLAVLSLLTGARTPVLPIKLCPAVKTVVGGVYVAAVLV